MFNISRRLTSFPILLNSVPEYQAYLPVQRIYNKPKDEVKLNINQNCKPIRIAVLSGDGIGKEVIPAALKVLDHLCVRLNPRSKLFEFVHLEMGWQCFLDHGSALPQWTIAGIKSCQV